jgi:tRNA threonylcarbamoyladenosine biosynthesis protein TsaE
MKNKVQWDIMTLNAWAAFAKHVATDIHDGDIITLSGPLGAGKTTFVQYLAKELGSKASPKSPTFALMRAYPVSKKGIRRLLHVDAYRIDDERDLLPLDLDEELQERGTVLVIEWPEKIPEWLALHPHKSIDISIKGEGREVRASS